MGGSPHVPGPLSLSVLLSIAQSPAAPVDPLQQAYAGMQHYTGEDLHGVGGQDWGISLPGWRLSALWRLLARQEKGRQGWLGESGKHHLFSLLSPRQQPTQQPTAWLHLRSRSLQPWLPSSPHHLLSNNSSSSSNSSKEKVPAGARLC